MADDPKVAVPPVAAPHQEMNAMKQLLRCARCGRRAYAALNEEDRMRQPDGFPCAGRFGFEPEAPAAVAAPLSEPDAIQQANNFLQNGGLWNPESMSPAQNITHMVLALRDQLAAERATVQQLTQQFKESDAALDEWQGIAVRTEQLRQQAVAALDAERALRGQLEKALEPFAAKCHADGIDAPYPEEEWKPMLWNAKEALAAARGPARPQQDPA